MFIRINPYLCHLLTRYQSTIFPNHKSCVRKKGVPIDVMELFYDQEQSTWNVEFEGNTAELLKMNENGTAQMVLPNGEAMTVILDAQGIAAARQAMMIDTYYAAR